MLAIVQLVSFVLLVVAGHPALNARTGTAWLLLVVRTPSRSCSPSTGRSGWSSLCDESPGPDADGALVAFTIFFAAAPLVGLGLLLAGPGASLVRAARTAALTRPWARETGRHVRRPSRSRSTPLSPTLLRRDPAGLVAAVVQQHDTGEVLMLAWMDDEALHRTLTTGRATYWSRSRDEYWVKGETSGNRQWVRDVRLDCDGDALLVLVDQEGAGLPHRRAHAASTGRSPASRGPRDEVRRHLSQPRGVRRAARPSRSWCR